MDMRKPQVVDLNESILRTAELAQSQIRPNQIQLGLKLSSKSPRVLANPAELAQVLLSLFTNAIDAISSVGSPGTILITSAVVRNHVLVSVFDDAPAKEADASNCVNLSRDFIQEIGGDMWVACSGVCGKTFIIDLPSASLN